MKAVRLFITILSLMCILGCGDVDYDTYLRFEPDTLEISAYTLGSQTPAKILTLEYSPGEDSVICNNPRVFIFQAEYNKTVAFKASFAVYFDPFDVAAGTYNETIEIRITASGGRRKSQYAEVPLTINVYETLTEPFPGLAFVGSDRHLYFQIEEDTPGVTTQTFDMSNQGGNTLNWVLSDNQTWLSVSPTSGDTTVEQDAINVEVDVTGLEGNLYYRALITLTSDSPFLPTETVEVVLWVYRP